MRVAALQGDTLDLICWRELGTTVDVVEQAYDLNPSLADAGPVLAEGTIVTLPDVLPAATLTRETINLWD